MGGKNKNMVEEQHFWGVGHIKTKICMISMQKFFYGKYWQLLYHILEHTHSTAKTVTSNIHGMEKTTVLKKRGKVVCALVLFVKWKIDARCFTIQHVCCNQAKEKYERFYTYLYSKSSTSTSS